MRRGFATKDRDSCSLMVPRSTAGIPGRKPPLCGWRFTAGIRFASWAPATCCWNGETCRALRICRLFRSDRRQASLGGNPRYVAGGLPLVSDSHRGHQQLAAGTEKRAALYGSADYFSNARAICRWREHPRFIGTCFLAYAVSPDQHRQDSIGTASNPRGDDAPIRPARQRRDLPRCRTRSEFPISGELSAFYSGRVRSYFQLRRNSRVLCEETHLRRTRLTL